VPLASEGGVSQVRLDAATMTEGRWSGGRRTHSRLGVSTMRLKDNCGVVAFGNRHLGWLQLLIQIHADSTGIGQGRVTSNLKPDIHLLTGALHVPDSASINMVYRLLDEEGLYVGASSALNVWAAAELAKRKGKGSTVVTVLCDGAYR
jgi:cysteine synthase